MCDVVWKLGDVDHVRRSRNAKEEIGADKLKQHLGDTADEYDNE